MSKVASLTITAKSRPKSSSCDSSPTSPNCAKDEVEDRIQQNENDTKRVGLTSSDSEEDKPMRRRGSSSGSSPERRLSSQRRYDTFDQERGLIHAGRSGKMSSRQRTLERELNTEDPSFVASSDDALASSDDGLEDNFIPRKSSDTYNMVKDKSDNEEGSGNSIYEKKNIEPPRAKSQPAGNRVSSATGRLMDNYVKDQSFDNLSDAEIEKPKTSVSVLKAAYSQKAVESKPVERYKVDEELEQIRFTMQNRGMMQREDSDDERNQAEPEVLYRKPLSSIKNRFFAAASGRRVKSSSDSEDDDAEEENKKEEILAASQPVSDIRSHWHEKGNWEDKIKELDDDMRVPLQSVVEMKKRWQEPRSWFYDEAGKEDVIYPEQKVADMTKQWQLERTFSVNQDDKEKLIALEQSVMDIKHSWPKVQSFDEENKVGKEDVIYPEQKVADMTNQWQLEQTFSVNQDDKEKLIALEQSVVDIKHSWPKVQSFDEENKENIEVVVVPPRPVVEMKEKWQQGDFWIEEEKINAREDIDVSQVGSARSAFKQMENRREAVSTVNKPRVNKIADPNSIMKERRNITYGYETEVDGVIRHEGQDELATLDMDVNQIKAAKTTFTMFERSNENGNKQVRRPSMKLIKQEDVSKTMDEHRKKVSAEDFDDYADHIRSNGTAAHMVNGNTAQ